VAEGASIVHSHTDDPILDMRTAEQGDEQIATKANEVIYIPDLGPFLTSILATIPMQLLAYHVATLKGTDVDQPRNLAKSVTVE